jgi:protocatechuate 3,4-dioxygenase beta subunit
VPTLYGEGMGGVSRRQALAGFGSVSLAALLAACSDDDGSAADATTARTSTQESEPPRSSAGELAARFDDAARCTRTAEETEGPFYFEVDRVRSDIREGRDGAPLRLGVRVRDLSNGCEPIPNAVVDVWHCDATGSYSEPGATYLRGLQVANRDGIVEFTTIYPGWYPGRTVHIHAKVHLDKQTVLTTQFYFDDAFTDRVFSLEPYAGDTGRDALNDSDPLFEKALELSLSKEGGAYLGLITLDVARA